MDDFLLMVSSEEEAYELRRRVERVLIRLGLKRNVKKGQWVPVQSVYLAVPAARLYLRELYFVLMKKRSWGAKLHTDSSLFAWGGVLNLKLEARGFWNDELRHLHITHLELEAVFKTVQAFLCELHRKVVRLYCDNQAVVAMLAHFTSRNPDLMRRMRRLWSLLDLNDIELQARHIRSEANEWADRLSRDTDIDDWKLNWR
ncbi:hypothetical protein CYMTET_8070 [Cymbomonas tetramitiformis]|uniref:Reverse transcriptase domain-containing protein n=1 Tax=Cymbomonas tetramitiformis TaxID=36881 RepID=A0AAE0LGU7_9CHLO|nr:hypothetical protein CYMTET_8070 [Cymbomonas tetramitiformis]